MPSIFLVWCGEYEQRGIMKAFADRETADAYVAHQERSPLKTNDLEIEELHLDPPDFERGAWQYTIQAPPTIGGWETSCCWHSGVNPDHPSSCCGPIPSPKGGVIGGATWTGYGATEQEARRNSENERKAHPEPVWLDEDEEK